MKRLLTLGVFFIVFGFTQNSAAQQNEKINKALTDYFFLERENIHVHFDKSVFISNEKIWFTGYIYHRKKAAPFFPTTNVFAILMDNEGKTLSKQLIYASNGSFSGSFELGNTLKTGKYYVQFYTNWMNNFTEDESAVYEISVINQETGTGDIVVKGRPADINIALSPEGGYLISGTSNSVGISVLGCNHKPAGITEAEITDSSGKIIKKITLSKQGYGKFEIDGSLQGLRAVVSYNGKKYEQPMPLAMSTGFSIQVNSYTSNNTIITLQTNKQTLSLLKDSQVFMVIHKDDKALILDVPITASQTEILLPLANADLFEGLNTVRILDSNLNQLAERVFYNHSANMAKVTVEKDREWEYDREYRIHLKPDMNASIAVLPENTAAIDESYDIFGDFLISPYLKDNEKINGKYYLSDPTRSKKYELDLFLLNQKSKYAWNNIINNPPKSTNTFDIGLSLKCTVNQKLSNKKDYKVRVSALSAMIDDYLEINDNNEFFMDNLIVADSTKLTFTLFEKGEKKQQLKIAPQIFNNNREYNKRFLPPPSCPLIEIDTIKSPDLPTYAEKTIELDEVQVTSVGKGLKYSRGMGNAQLRAYKITDTESKSFFYILDLIRYHGFDVEQSGPNVGIYGRTVNTINGQRTTPLVYVDNMRILSYDQLIGVQTADVDEFYINQHAMVPSVDNRMGIIKIYMRRDYSRWNKKFTEASFIITNGFRKIEPFANAAYRSYSNAGFYNFGLLDWQPLASTDEHGNFGLTLPPTAQGTVKLVIEGMGNDGSLFSEITTIKQ